jgi:hypothetical protein
MAGIFDYDTSILNPVLKIIIALLFVAISFIYYDVRKKYGGNVKSFVTGLFYFAIFVFIASTFRYFGDGIDFGFTKDYSLKWLQSIGFLIASLIYLLAGKKMLTLLGED